MALQIQPHGQQSAHILVVDDDESVARLLESMLKPYYRVTLAADGGEALDLLRFTSVDLILSDIDMPEVNGFELLTAIRDTPEYTVIPVILLSALSDSNDVAHGLEMGANDYLTKPLDRPVVLARIRTQLTLKHLLDSQKQMIDELKSIQLMRDRFFHIASHDLKSPMNNIRMAHFLLRSMMEEDPSVDVLLDNIELALDSMRDIVSDFLDTAAIQSQALEVNLSEVIVEDALWDVIIQFNINAQKKNIVLKIEDAQGQVWADSRRLVQALSNLISNAIKYSPRDSVVTLSTARFGDSIRIFIQDQGPGIPPEEHELLFSEFAKLSTMPTDGEGRTGLGLWIVKQLITLQEGTVGVEFPEEGGSIFWIELPAAPEAVTKYAVNS
ncbi:MAG: hypothetical protein CL610_22515 [Anaerolineaceae bacterium]|nr:hypothetical protein [Anaerolineaceae bacterium]